MKEHRRQFVIAPGPCLVDDEWEAHELPNGYVLSRHRALPMSSVDIGDRQVTVLGYAIPPMNEAT